jgi:hypothetical protein
MNRRTLATRLLEAEPDDELQQLPAPQPGQSSKHVSTENLWMILGYSGKADGFMYFEEGQDERQALRRFLAESGLTYVKAEDGTLLVGHPEEGQTPEATQAFMKEYYEENFETRWFWTCHVVKVKGRGHHQEAVIW